MWKNIPGKGIDSSMLNRLSDVDFGEPTVALVPRPMGEIINQMLAEGENAEIEHDRKSGTDRQ